MNSFKIIVLGALLAVMNPAVSDSMPGQTYYPPVKSQPAPESYGQTISTKLGSGFSNVTLAIVEVPKNIINTTNEVNLALGVTGGVFKGFLHTAGRTMAGLVDVLTFPIPTVPITNPPFPWQDFTRETKYNPLFKFKN